MTVPEEACKAKSLVRVLIFTEARLITMVRKLRDLLRRIPMPPPAPIQMSGARSEGQITLSLASLPNILTRG